MLDIHRHSMIINSLLQTSFSQWHLAFCWFFFVGSWPPKSGDIWWPGSPRNDGDKNAHQNWIEVLQQGKKNAFETWNSKFQNWHFNSPSIFLGQKLKDFHAFNFNKTYFSQSKTHKFQWFFHFHFSLRESQFDGMISCLPRWNLPRPGPRRGTPEIFLWCQCGFINSEHLGLPFGYLLHSHGNDHF